LKYDVPWEVLYNVNVVGTKNVFEEILRSGSTPKRVVVWSTNGIYGVPEPDELPIREDSPVKPTTRYALSKFLEEKTALLYYRKHNIPVTIIKPTAVYGPRESYMFLDTLRNFKRLKFIASPSNLTVGFPSVHAVDVVRAAMHLAQIPETEGEDYIVDDDSKNTAIDILRFSAEIFEKPFYLLPPIPLELIRTFLLGISFIDERLSNLIGKKPSLEHEFMFMFGYDMRYSNEKLKSTGFKFKYPRFQDGIRETIKWYEGVGLL
jgi:nucleoside-diphosphate-sugar epimerase